MSTKATRSRWHTEERGQFSVARGAGELRPRVCEGGARARGGDRRGGAGGGDTSRTVCFCTESSGAVSQVAWRGLALLSSPLSSRSSTFQQRWVFVTRDMRGGAMAWSRPPKTRKALSVKLLKTAASPSCDAASPRDVSGLLVGQCCSVARQWTSRDARCATHGAASRDAVATSRDALRRTMDARRRAMAIVRHR